MTGSCKWGNKSHQIPNTVYSYKIVGYGATFRTRSKLWMFILLLTAKTA